MEPTTTLMEFVAALNKDFDIDTAVERAEALHEWLHEKKGAMPDVMALGGLTRDGLLCLLTSFMGYFGDPQCGNHYALKYKEILEQPLAEDWNQK